METESLFHRLEPEAMQPTYHYKGRVYVREWRRETEGEKLGAGILLESLNQAVPRASPTPGPFTSDGQ